jgi:flagellar motor switch protein FliG
MAAPKGKGQSQAADEATSFSRMNGLQKSSLILNAIGDEAASSILKHMKDHDIRRLLQTMSKMKKAPVATIKKALTEFYRILSEENEVIFESDAARQKFMESLGEERAKVIFGAGGMQGQQKTLDALEMVDTRTLANYLTNEHPQTIALIMAHLPVEKRSDVLRRLPDAVQGEAVLRMANLDYISPELIEQVNEVLKQGLAAMGTMEMTQLGGVEPVAEMFNLMDKTSEQSIMARVEEKDPLLAEEIRKLMFVFEDLVKVDDKGMGLILKEVSNDVLLKALKNAPEGVKEKIFRNMSKRGAEMVKADLETLGPMRVSDVEGAQQAIVAIARRLEEEGKIYIDRGGSGDGFV